MGLSLANLKNDSITKVWLTIYNCQLKTHDVLGMRHHHGPTRLTGRPVRIIKPMKSHLGLIPHLRELPKVVPEMAVPSQRGVFQCSNTEFGLELNCSTSSVVVHVTLSEMSDTVPCFERKSRPCPLIPKPFL